MGKIRVLVVDDAVVIRKILSDLIEADSNLEVVGSAPNGKLALQKIPQLNPDVVTLDIEMPEMNGLETLKHIRKDYPKLPVIMFSTLTEKGACTTLDCLAAGASDYVTKPANVGGVTASREAIEKDLIRKIKALVPSTDRKTPPVASVRRPPVASVDTKSAPVEILAIGVSTGGPNALAAMLPQLPPDLGIPVVIVQHMPPMFTKLLAERLDAQTKLRVVEAVSGEVLKPGVVYIAPGDYHLELARGATGAMTHLQKGPPENSCRPAVDPLFRSVARLYGKNALGIILTGMGQDGLRGSEAIKEAGGRILVQDKESSVVWGMPGYVAEANLADGIFPLSSIAPEITRRVKISRSGTPSMVR
jgi:two-component system, chemotaxis family, protein-glutamate methylesterase/glutaminase